MPSVQIITAIAFAKTGAQVMARIAGQSGALITQASLTTIHRRVTNDQTGAEISASTALTISAVVFDTLQTDARWTKDATGYGFLDVVTAAILTTANIIHLVEYKFTPVSGQVFGFAVKIPTLKSLTF